MVRVENVEQEVVYKLYCTPFLRECTHNISCYAAFTLLALAISKKKEQLKLRLRPRIDIQQIDTKLFATKLPIGYDESIHANRHSNLDISLSLY